MMHNFFLYVYFYSLHVSGSHVPIIRRINCIKSTPGICHSEISEQFKIGTSYTLKFHLHKNFIKILSLSINNNTHFKAQLIVILNYSLVSEWHITGVARIQLILLMMGTWLFENVENRNKYIRNNRASSWFVYKEKYSNSKGKSCYMLARQKILYFFFVNCFFIHTKHFGKRSSDSSTKAYGRKYGSTSTRCCNYSLSVLLVMGELIVRNMWSSLQKYNKTVYKLHIFWNDYWHWFTMQGPMNIKKREMVMSHETHYILAVKSHYAGTSQCLEVLHSQEQSTLSLTLSGAKHALSYTLRRKARSHLHCM